MLIAACAVVACGVCRDLSAEVGYTVTEWDYTVSLGPFEKVDVAVLASPLAVLDVGGGIDDLAGRAD